MTGASVPYYLRPHKAVDRRLFLDLLMRFERWLPLSGYAYVSMGAYALEDARLVHRLLGITRLVSFDADEGIVARQKFNRPIETCYCIAQKSGELITNLDRILKDAGIQSNCGRIVWLDYTDPAKLSEQLREFQGLLDKLQPGDIVRVTVNANPRALDGRMDAGRPLQIEEKLIKRLEKLKERLGEYLPPSIDPNHMAEDVYPSVLAQAFSAAVLKAKPVSEKVTFSPLSIVRYADGQQMLSMTGALVERGSVSSMADRMGIRDWPFASTDWLTVHKLVVPHLTLRERLFLERGVMARNEDELIGELGFAAADSIGIREFLENYKSYYRFYPTLLPADV